MLDNTKQRIARAYAGLAAERGDQSLVVKEVLARAGVSRSTFYYHFRDMDDVVQYLMDSFIDEYERRIPTVFRRAPTDADERIRLLSEDLRGFYRFIYENRTTYTALANSRHGDYFRHRLTRMFRSSLQQADWVFAQGNEQYRRLTAVDRDYYAYYSAHALVGIIECWMDRGFADDPETFLRRLVRIVNLSYDNPYVE